MVYFDNENEDREGYLHLGAGRCFGIEDIYFTIVKEIYAKLEKAHDFS